MAAGPSAAPNLHSIRWPEVLAHLDYLARYAPPASGWREKFLATFRRAGASKERWVPVIESMREAAVLNEDEEFFCRAVPRSSCWKTFSTSTAARAWRRCIEATAPNSPSGTSAGRN
jgi:hypothetical protein